MYPFGIDVHPGLFEECLSALMQSCMRQSISVLLLTNFSAHGVFGREGNELRQTSDNFWLCTDTPGLQSAE